MFVCTETGKGGDPKVYSFPLCKFRAALSRVPTGETFAKCLSINRVSGRESCRDNVSLLKICSIIFDSFPRMIYLEAYSLVIVERGPFSSRDSLGRVVNVYMLG